MVDIGPIHPNPQDCPNPTNITTMADKGPVYICGCEASSYVSALLVKELEGTVGIALYDANAHRLIGGVRLTPDQAWTVAQRIIQEADKVEKKRKSE